MTFCLFFSCTKDLDFDQIDDFSATPVVKSSILFFTLNQFHFLSTSGEVNTVRDLLPFNFLESKYVKENLEKVEIEFRIDNQFNRNFTVDVEFLDDSNAVTHSFSTFNISSNDSSFIPIETILVSSNSQFLSSTKIRVTINLLPSSNGSTLDSAVDQTIKFESGGTYYFKI